MPQAELPPSIISHVSIGTNDFDRAKAFYTAVLGTLEVKVMMEHPGAVAFGREFPEFWVGVPHDGGKAACGQWLALWFPGRVEGAGGCVLCQGAGDGRHWATARPARGLCMGRRITVVMCGTWMGTRSRRSSRMPLRLDLCRACWPACLAWRAWAANSGGRRFLPLLLLRPLLRLWRRGLFHSSSCCRRRLLETPAAVH
jgi:predicted enzyme related to lactoylglutathione lyase